MKTTGGNLLPAIFRLPICKRYCLSLIGHLADPGMRPYDLNDQPGLTSGGKLTLVLLVEEEHCNESELSAHEDHELKPGAHLEIRVKID